MSNWSQFPPIFRGETSNNIFEVSPATSPFIYHKHQPNVGKYTIHEFYDYEIYHVTISPPSVGFICFRATEKLPVVRSVASAVPWPSRNDRFWPMDQFCRISVDFLCGVFMEFYGFYGFFFMDFG